MCRDRSTVACRQLPGTYSSVSVPLYSPLRLALSPRYFLASSFSSHPHLRAGGQCLQVMRGGDWASWDGSSWQSRTAGASSSRRLLESLSLARGAHFGRSRHPLRAVEGNARRIGALFLGRWGGALLRDALRIAVIVIVGVRTRVDDPALRRLPPRAFARAWVRRRGAGPLGRLRLLRFALVAVVLVMGSSACSSQLGVHSRATQR